MTVRDVVAVQDSVFCIDIVFSSKARARGRWLAGIAGSNLAGTWISAVNVVCCQRGLCDGPITCPGKCYRLRCVTECGPV